LARSNEKKSGRRKSGLSFRPPLAFGMDEVRGKIKRREIERGDAGERKFNHVCMERGSSN